MGYKEISEQAEKLNYRDKLRLAQLLIQLARKEEEEQYPEKRADEAASGPSDPELIQYVADRLEKLKPAKKGRCLTQSEQCSSFKEGCLRVTRRK